MSLCLCACVSVGMRFCNYYMGGTRFLYVCASLSVYVCVHVCVYVRANV